MPKSFENPLMPHRTLREMYLAMFETRLLAPVRKPRPASIPRNLEACWVATAIGLRDQPGDLVSDPGAGPALDRILDGKLRLKAVLAGKADLDPATGPVRLRSTGTPAERLTYATGAAMALVATGRKRVILAYANQSDLTRAQWKTMLQTSQANELPIVYMILPEDSPPFDLARWSQACGVPGIPVDAADAIATYRVAQESIGRARAGGGPALIAAVAFPPGSKKPADPLPLLRRQLIQKGVSTERWLTAAEARVTRAHQTATAR